MSADLELYGIDLSHARLLDLAKLADQARPFYFWAETQLQMVRQSAEPLERLVLDSDLPTLRVWITKCYEADDPSTLPKLFDGGGIPYPHRKACFFFFSWMARDAATQRLRPLLSQAKKNAPPSVTGAQIEIDAVSRLIHKYRTNLQFFEWPVIREVTLQRLEGSRRAKRGSAIEIYVRSALSRAFAYYFQTRGNYGRYSNFRIGETPLKVNNRTYDVVAELILSDGSTELLVIPVKTRETQGGGHAHLFSRDIEQANVDILGEYPNARLAFVIIAQNWSAQEIDVLRGKYLGVFYFDQSPPLFAGFDDENQQALNGLIEEVLGNES